MADARPRRAPQRFAVLLLALLASAPAAVAFPSFPWRRSAVALEAARTAEQRLADLGYWAGPIDGRLDAVSRRALLAFQRVAGRELTGRLTLEELAALESAQPLLPRDATGPHIEVDLARQLLYLVDPYGRAYQIVTISSGSGRPFHYPGKGSRLAVTPCGRFTVYRKLSGWRRSPLGRLHNPLYINGGIAIHGAGDVPLRPASHGCIRIPMYASHVLGTHVELETPVLVYGCADEET